MYNNGTSHEACLFVFEGTVNPTQHRTESCYCGLNVKHSMKVRVLGACIHVVGAILKVSGNFRRWEKIIERNGSPWEQTLKGILSWPLLCLSLFSVCLPWVEESSLSYAPAKRVGPSHHALNPLKLPSKVDVSLLKLFSQEFWSWLWKNK